MTEKTTPTQARPDSFHAVLTPHRSLGRRDSEFASPDGAWT